MLRRRARTRVAWHHPAHAAPAVYGSLTVELLAAGLLRASWLRPFLGEEATASLVKRANEQALFSAEAPKPAPKPAVTLVRCSEDKVAETCESCYSHHRLCGGDCTVGGYFSFEKANLGVWAEAHPEWSSEIYELEMKLRWNALDEDGKKVFGREGVCEPEPMLVDCGGGEVAESCAACARATVCVKASATGFGRKLQNPRIGSNGRMRNSARITGKTRRGFTAHSSPWASAGRTGVYGQQEAERQCAAESADGECLSTASARPSPRRKSRKKTPGPRPSRASPFSKAAGQFIRETWPALLVLAIVAFILISQRTVIQHVLHKMSETFFELYIIALTDACVRHALLMGVADHSLV